jgi:hypothetical protein
MNNNMEYPDTVRHRHCYLILEIVLFTLIDKMFTLLSVKGHNKNKRTVEIRFRFRVLYDVHVQGFRKI